jgi:hypothetical protein
VDPGYDAFIETVGRTLRLQKLGTTGFIFDAFFFRSCSRHECNHFLTARWWRSTILRHSATMCINQHISQWMLDTRVPADDYADIRADLSAIALLCIVTKSTLQLIPVSGIKR